MMLDTVVGLTRLAAAALMLMPPFSSSPNVTTARAGVAVLKVEGRTSANPTVAVDGQFVSVVWSAATVSSMDIYASVSRDGGATFSQPVQVNNVAGEARVSGEEPPRVGLVARKGRDPEIVVVWTSRAGANWKLLSARSVDGGRSYSSATQVPGSDGGGSRGWQSVAVDKTGRVAVLWLDHRGLVAADSQHKHTMPGSGAPATPMPMGDPTARAGLSEVYIATLDGKGATSIAKSPCYCCKTTIAFDGDNMYGVWRHVFAGGYRDMAFVRSTDRGKSFGPLVRVSEDKWKIDGCPDNGPSLAVDRTHRVHVAWPAGSDGGVKSELSLYYALSKDGRTFGARTKIPTRGPGSHVQVAMGADDTPIVAWDEIIDGTRRLGFARARVDASGSVSFTAIPAPDAGAGQWYPALASSSGGAVAVWVRQREGGSDVGVARVR